MNRIESNRITTTKKKFIRHVFVVIIIIIIKCNERKSRKNCHLPPESFRGPYDPSKVDMWSLGVLMVCLQTRSYPFNVNSTSKFSAQWRQFVLKHEMNRYVRAAINQTFSIDPKRRVKPADFLKHPYFTASVSNIEPKVLKTTVDPKYDPNMIDDENGLNSSLTNNDIQQQFFFSCIF